MQPGKRGQCAGASNIGAEPVDAWTCIEAISADIAQWCAPWRRQQAGRRDSEFTGKTNANGPNPKIRIRIVQNVRRIMESARAGIRLYALTATQPVFFGFRRSLTSLVSPLKTNELCPGSSSET